MFATLTHGFWFHYPKGISVYWDLADGFAVKEKPKNHKEPKKYCNDWLINYIGKGII